MGHSIGVNFFNTIPKIPTTNESGIALPMNRSLSSLPISEGILVSRVKAAEDYAGHSLRTGGTTVPFVARVPYYIIQRTQGQ